MDILLQVYMFQYNYTVPDHEDEKSSGIDTIVRRDRKVNVLSVCMGDARGRTETGGVRVYSLVLDDVAATKI